MTKRLLVIDGDDRGQFFLSIEAGTLTVGGDAEHAAVVLRDLHISRIRCEVEVDEDKVVLGGLDAEEDDLALRQELHPGEAVHAGLAHLRLEAAAEDAPARAAADDEDTIGLAEEPAAEGNGQARPAAEDESPAEEQLHKRLLVVDGADQGRTFPLPAEGTVNIGNSQKSADIVLHDLYVSRVHCELAIAENQIFVTHVAGQNGTMINGQKVTRQEMKIGDTLRVGNSHLRLELAVTEAQEDDTQEETDYEVLDDAEVEAEVLDEEEVEAEVVEEQEAVEAAEKSDAAYSLPHSPVDQLLRLEDQVLGHYQVGPLLGRGQAGLVFRAQDRRNHQVVALKVLSPDFPANDAELQRFVKAMKVVPHIQHPNLVTPHGAGKTGAYCWIAREYVEGESAARLVQRLENGGKPDWTRACRVAVHLSRTLDHLHKFKVTHGNLTPRNVLIRQSDRATKLADLLLTRALERSVLQKAILEKKLLAELPYLAPDPNPFASPLADLYSLGTVLYALLTGRPPFAGESPRELLTRVREGKVVKPSKLQQGIPADFESAVLKTMARRPEDRFQTAAEMLAAFEAIAQEHGVKV
jgi:hypothetical protein